MRTVIIVFVLIVLIVFVSKNQKDILLKRMLFLFIGYWGIALVGSSIGVEGFFKPSNMAFFLLLAYVFMFSLGFCESLKKTYQPMCSSELHLMINQLISSRLFMMLVLLALGLSLYYYGIMRTLYAYTGSLEDVRSGYYDHSLYGHAFIWLNHLFLEPMRYLCVPVFGYMLLFKRNWKLIVIVSFLFIYSSLNGGRLAFLRLVLGVIFVLFCVFHDVKMKIRIRSIILLIIVLFGFFFLISILTAGRSGDAVNRESTLNAFIHYLCGPMTAFDYAINNGYVERMGGYTYGRLTFSSVDGLIKYLVQPFGVDYETALERLALFKQGERISIGYASTWNALYTGQLFSWLDGGVIGCFLFPLICGVFFKFICNSFYKYRNWPFFVLLSAFFQLCMETTIDFKFISPFTLIAFLLLYFLGKTNTNRLVKSN